MSSFHQRTLVLAVLGFALAALVAPIPARAQDGDFDGLADSLELGLAQWYFPILNLHCGSYEGLAYADRRQLYGLDVPGYTNSSNGRIPFVAHPYNPGTGDDCTEPLQCIELRYGIAWNWDLGDNWLGHAHSGDSELYAILLARKDTDGADWGVSWEVAQNDPSRWRLMQEFMSAHWQTAGESSTYRSHGNFGTTSFQRVWCAEGKHAMYPTQNACNNGGWADADDCSDNRCDIVTEVFLKVQNAGELAAPLQPVIPAPAPLSIIPPAGSYNVWSGASFGESTNYRAHLTRPLAWCRTVSEYCMPDCAAQNPECPYPEYVYSGNCPQDCGFGPEPGGIRCVAYACY